MCGEQFAGRWFRPGDLTCASFSHRLSGGESSSDGGDHHLVQSSWPQGLEAEAADVRLHALVLDDAAVMDQQDPVRVQISRSWFPLRLQAVNAAEVGNLQVADWSWC